MPDCCECCECKKRRTVGYMIEADKKAAYKATKTIIITGLKTLERQQRKKMLIELIDEWVDGGL